MTANIFDHMRITTYLESLQWAGVNVPRDVFRAAVRLYNEKETIPYFVTHRRKVMPATRQPVCSPSRVARYTAKHKPRCNRGHGCPTCWAKWINVNPLAAVVTPDIFKPYVETGRRSCAA